MDRVEIDADAEPTFLIQVLQTSCELRGLQWVNRICFLARRHFIFVKFSYVVLFITMNVEQSHSGCRPSEHQNMLADLSCRPVSRLLSSTSPFIITQPKSC